MNRRHDKDEKKSISMTPELLADLKKEMVESAIPATCYVCNTPNTPCVPMTKQDNPAIVQHVCMECLWGSKSFITPEHLN